MEPTSGRLVFKIGEAFPSDDCVAVFIVAMSAALNDLMTVSKWLTGGDYDAPKQFEVSDVEQQYLLRLTFAQIHELRETLKHAKRDVAVVAFLKALPEQARDDLDRLMTFNEADTWVASTVKYVRNQTNHYGGKYGWDDLTWAMTQTADIDGEIEMRNTKLVGMRLKYADSIMNQHLSRKWPEYEKDPHAELDNGTISQRLKTLIIAVRDVVIAAQNFAVAVVQAYVDQLPEGVVRVEDATYAGGSSGEASD